MMGFGILYMFIFWVFIIALGIWLLSQLFPKVAHDSSSRKTARSDALSDLPLEIIRQRYARGEISKAEFEEMRQDLER